MVTMINVPIVNQSLPKRDNACVEFSFWFSVGDLAVLTNSKLQEQHILSYHTDHFFIFYVHSTSVRYVSSCNPNIASVLSISVRFFR